MAKVRTKIAWPGKWKSPQGDTEITPERVLHWQKLTRELRGMGVRFPVPWGHLSTAMPAEAGDADAEKFLSSRFNAGYLDDLEIDPDDGGGVAVLDCPGLAEEDGHLVSVVEVNGSPVKTAIREVSPAVGGNWTDGKGREWSDIIAHVALSLLPVQMGQPGFSALGTGKAEGFFYLASKPPAKKDAKPADLAPDLMDAAAQDETEYDGAEEELAGDVTNDPLEGYAQSIKASLSKLGVDLPDQTDSSNIVEHLAVALSTLVSRCDAEKAEQDQAKARNATSAGPREVAAPGVMLSTLKASNPVAYSLAASEDQRQRKRRKGRIEAMKKRGLPVALADRLAAESEQTQLSLDPAGQLLPSRIDRDLWLLSQVLPKPDDPQSLLSTAAPLPTPVEEPAGETPEKDEFGLPVNGEVDKDIRERAARYSRAK